jgi:hypothetical protein
LQLKADLEKKNSSPSTISKRLFGALVSQEEVEAGLR